MAIVNSIIATIASLSNIPMTLESGLSWDRNMTRFLMKNSPFFIRLTVGNGIEFVTSNGDWLVRTTPITEAKRIGHDTVYFVTSSGHKYILCIDPDYMEKLNSQFPLKKPEMEAVKQYTSFTELPRSNQERFWENQYYYFNKAAEKDGKAMGLLSAKRPDYGFVDGVFCHVSDCADKISNLTEFNGEDIVGEVVTTNRGQKLVNYTFDDGVVGKYIIEAEEMYVKSINDNLLETANWRYERLMKDYNAQKDAWGQLGFCALDKKHESTNKAYMDNKSETMFTFTRSISKNEFYSYLNLLGYEIKEEKAGWWDDYSMISGSGNSWTYTWVHTSTH